LQNKEFSDGRGLELYDAGFRTLDPQLGRFTQIDPLADRSQFNSTYSYADDDPVLLNDPGGLKTHLTAPSQVLKVINSMGCPSIEQLNAMSGINWNMGADAGPYAQQWNAIISGLMAGGGGSSMTNNGNGTWSFNGPSQYEDPDMEVDPTAGNAPTQPHSINIWSVNPLTGESDLYAVITSSFLPGDVNICVPYLLGPASTPHTVNLDNLLGSDLSTMAGFVINQTRPDAVIVDLGISANASSWGGGYGIQLVVFPNSTDPQTTYMFGYALDPKNGFIVGAGIQVGYGWMNYTNDWSPGIASPESYVLGTASYMTMGALAGSLTYTGSSFHNDLLWHTVTAGLSFDLGIDAKLGFSYGTVNSSLWFPVGSCH
jgi:RHS repeat-associated protein